VVFDVRQAFSLSNYDNELKSLSDTNPNHNYSEVLPYGAIINPYP